MITIDSVRTALRHPQPWTAMDELVRAEQAAGRKVREIHDELWALVEPLRAIDNPPEDADDAMMDTLDALAGNCRSEDRYTDPSNTLLPTKEDVLALPRWARVAFAARCARRVLQLYYKYRPPKDVLPHRALRYKIQDPEWAVREAELSAASARSRNDSQTGFIEAVSNVHDLYETGDEIAHNATNAAAYAAADAGDDSRPERAWFAMNYAVAASKPVADITKSLHHDFDLLARTVLANQWDGNTPVPPEVFGPLWPDGQLTGWPANPDAPQHTDITLEVVNREGVDERIVEDEVVNLFNAMNRYHIARGGSPLTLEDLQPLISALVPAGV